MHSLLALPICENIASGCRLCPSVAAMQGKRWCGLVQQARLPDCTVVLEWLLLGQVHLQADCSRPLSCQWAQSWTVGGTQLPRAGRPAGAPGIQAGMHCTGMHTACPGCRTPKSPWQRLSAVEAAQLPKTKEVEPGGASGSDGDSGQSIGVALRKLQAGSGACTAAPVHGLGPGLSSQSVVSVHDVARPCLPEGPEDTLPLSPDELSPPLSRAKSAALAGKRLSPHVCNPALCWMPRSTPDQHACKRGHKGSAAVGQLRSHADLMSSTVLMLCWNASPACSCCIFGA